MQKTIDYRHESRIGSGRISTDRIDCFSSSGPDLCIGGIFIPTR
jgi:hypothetical protein